MSQPAIPEIIEGYVKTGKLEPIEAQWLMKLFEYDFADKRILVEQIGSAKMTRIQDAWHYDLRFDYDEDPKELASLKSGSPVNMQVLQKGQAPIYFDLLIWDHKIDQLLIQSAALDEVDFLDINFEDVMYSSDLNVQA